MHAVIFGTGKWAQLLKIKLLSLNVSSVLVGSDTNVADYSREDFSRFRHTFNRNLIFIASQTKNHFYDFLEASLVNPKAIFIEKGFSKQEEKDSARIWQPSIPKYVLCQYRYSKVFDVLEPYKDSILKVSYDWQVNNSIVSEWIPHIISIDNFIKNKNNELYIDTPGYHIIDLVSDIRITYGDSRILKIYVETTEEKIQIELGITNGIYISRKKDGITAMSTFIKEDVLQLQLEDIITNLSNTKLERL